MENTSAEDCPENDDARPAAEPLAPGLYLAATPIGAANDITLRVLDVLRRADILVAEDTRNLRKLMEIHSVPLGRRPLIPYHDRNGPEARPKIMRQLLDGKSVVYASDAGTPLVADPGYRLAETVREAELTVVVLPGASAVLAGLLASGLPTDAFAFCGFPPTKSSKRKTFLSAWAGAPGTLVFFEAPRRLAECLRDMSEIFGDRPAAVMRELTKRFEETRRGALSELAAQYAQEAPPRGEAVVAVGPPLKSDPASDAASREAEIDAMLLERLGLESVKDAARTVAEHMHIPRKAAYERALVLKKGSDAEE